MLVIPDKQFLIKRFFSKNLVIRIKVGTIYFKVCLFKISRTDIAVNEFLGKLVNYVRLNWFEYGENSKLLVIFLREVCRTVWYI